MSPFYLKKTLQQERGERIGSLHPFPYGPTSSWIMAWTVLMTLIPKCFLWRALMTGPNRWVEVIFMCHGTHSDPSTNNITP